MTRAFLESLIAGLGLAEKARCACDRILELEKDLADPAARQYVRARRKLPAPRLRR